MVATDGTYVYWGANNQIFRCPVLGCGGSTPPAYEPGPYYFANGLAFGDASVYWTESGYQDDSGSMAGRIWKSDNGIVPSAAPIVPGQAYPDQGITSDGTSIYWCNLGSPPLFIDGTVMKADLDGQNAHVLASSQKSPGGLVVFGGRVYWTNFGSGPSYVDGSVMTCAVDSCAPTPLALDEGGPLGLFVDASGAYWTTVWPSADAGMGSALPIMRCSPPTAGCTPTPIASGQIPFALAGDDRAIYWTDLGKSTVMGLAK